MTLRVGVIGTGVMGAEHARLLTAEVAGSTVSAVHDIDPDRVQQTARTLRAAPLSSAHELITSPQVDAVVIASHDDAHADQVMACLAVGKPVLCEKPLAATLAECRQIVDEECRLGIRLVSVGFMRRFHPAFTALRHTITSAELGAALLVLGSHRNVTSYPFGGSEGTIRNSAVHDIDTSAWMLGSPIVEVSWHAPRPTSQDTSRQDPQLIHLRTENGALAVIDVFVNARYGYDVRFEVVCEQGAARLSPLRHISVDAELRSAYSYPPDWRQFFVDAYRLELQAWVDATVAGRQPALASAADGLRATAVAEALVTSMHQDGAVVAVDHVAESR